MLKGRIQTTIEYGRHELVINEENNLSGIMMHKLQ